MHCTWQTLILPPKDSLQRDFGLGITARSLHRLRIVPDRKCRRKLQSTVVVVCRIDLRYIPPNAIHLDSFWPPPHCPLRPFCRWWWLGSSVQSTHTLFYVAGDTRSLSLSFCTRMHTCFGVSISSTQSRTHSRTPSFRPCYPM